MNAVTQVPVETIEDALSPYQLGELIRFWPAVNGIENSNYFVQLRQTQRVREYVLTIMEQSAYSGDHYFALMQILDQAGLPVAPPIPDAAGNLKAEVNQKPAMLAHRLSGQHIYNPTDQQIAAIGRFLARLHNAATIEHNSLETIAHHPRDLQWVQNNIDYCRGKIAYADFSVLQQAAKIVDSLHSREDLTQLPCGVIHGDLFRDNVLFNSAGLSGVLDFHHASFGLLVFDLAVVANDWCNDSTGVMSSERTTLLLKAYHQIRPLTATELWLFPMFSLYAALTFWLSRLVKTIEAKHAAVGRTKNPNEFRKIVVHQLAQQYYVDSRLLEF